MISTSTATTRRLSTPRPLQLTNSNTESHPKASSSAPSTPNSSASIPSSFRRKPCSRRQSSIAYLPHDSCPRYGIQSPSHLKRSNSVDFKIDSSSFVKGQRKHTDSITEPRFMPLTLGDKHADLLRFIAQKESKCMELRSQLAVHEAELMQLKHKWERIVNKGYDRVIGVNGNSASSSHTSGVSSAQVFGGIKEGMERLLAAGLGELTPATTTQAVFSTRMREHITRQSISSVGTSSTSYSQSSTNSSAMEDDFSLESPGEQEQEGEVLIVENAEPTLTVCPNLTIEIAKVMEMTSMEQDGATEALRRRSRDTLPSVDGKLATVPENNRTGSVVSIPSLGSLPPGTPSWIIGTVGKKWEELQRTETFAKNQKRASLLISDMSQSLMNVWSSPMESPASSMANTSAAPDQCQSKPLLSTSSLLDDDGDPQEVLGEVMTPDSKSPTKSTTLDRTQVQEDDSDEWNW